MFITCAFLLLICSHVAHSKVEDIIAMHLPCNVELIWEDKFKADTLDVTIYQPFLVHPLLGWKILGQYAQPNLRPPEHKMYVFKDMSDDHDNFRMPLTFTQLWYNKNCAMRVKEKVWRPVCPEGYVSLGDIFHKDEHSEGAPLSLRERHACVKKSLTVECYNKYVTYTTGLFCTEMSIWSLDEQHDMYAPFLVTTSRDPYIAVSSFNQESFPATTRPPTATFYCLKKSAVTFIN